MLDKKVLGQRLRDVREARGITRKEVAELLGVSKTQINDLENGKSGTNLDRFCQLCQLYRISSDYFLNFTDDPTWRGGHN